MAWVKTKDIHDPTKPKPPLTISVNKWSGMRINSEVYKEMGEPRWVELEYDADTRTLRFKPGQNIVTEEVIGQMVKLPLMVRTEMSNYDKRHSSTQRFLVELNEDGWWYTTTPAR